MPDLLRPACGGWVIVWNLHLQQSAEQGLGLLHRDLPVAILVQRCNDLPHPSLQNSDFTLTLTRRAACSSQVAGGFCYGVVVRGGEEDIRTLTMRLVQPVLRLPFPGQGMATSDLLPQEF